MASWLVDECSFIFLDFLLLIHSQLVVDFTHFLTLWQTQKCSRTIRIFFPYKYMEPTYKWLVISSRRKWTKEANHVRRYICKLVLDKKLAARKINDKISHDFTLIFTAYFEYLMLLIYNEVIFLSIWLCRRCMDYKLQGDDDACL